MWFGTDLKVCRVFISVVTVIMAEADGKSPDVDHSEAPALGKTDSQVMNALDLKGHLLKDTKDKENLSFPNNLQEFGFKFNEKGQLRTIEGGRPFEFKVKNDHHYNQKRYEALGEIITEYVYKLLEEEAKLKKVLLPVSAEEVDPHSFFFMSEDAMDDSAKLLILMHGSGVVRAGQWARRLIINESLECGTQMPYIKRGRDLGYGIMVLNTNKNTFTKNGEEIPIPENGSPEDHASYVWDHFISKSKARQIAVVAHSYGGVVATELAKKYVAEFEDKVFAIAFTDSVHNLLMQETPQRVINIYKQKAINWVSHSDPLDTLISCESSNCPKFSAGHPKHEWTSWSAFEAVFKFLEERYSKVVNVQGDNMCRENKEKDSDNSCQSELYNKEDEIKVTKDSGPSTEQDKMEGTLTCLSMTKKNSDAV